MFPHNFLVYFFSNQLCTLGFYVTFNVNVCVNDTV